VVVLGLVLARNSATVEVMKMMSELLVLGSALGPVLL